MANENELVKEFTDKKYEYGFTTDIHTEIIDRGLNEDVIRLISEKKANPNGFSNSVSRLIAIGSL